MDPLLQPDKKSQENSQNTSTKSTILQPKLKPFIQPKLQQGSGYFTKSQGNKLPENVQSKMESSFGQDFSDVNIHTDSDNATKLGAKAYAQGKDVHFAPGEFQPNSKEGQELIGHELTHVVQQKEGKVQGGEVHGKDMVNQDVSLEKEADDAGKLASEGKSVEVKGSGNGVQRKVEGNIDQNLKSPYFVGIPELENVLDKKRVLAIGDTGAGVTALQKALIAMQVIRGLDWSDENHKYLVTLRKSDLSDTFGPKTHKSLAIVQTKFGLAGTGILDSTTLSLFDRITQTAPFADSFESLVEKLNGPVDEEKAIVEKEGGHFIPERKFDSDPEKKEFDDKKVEIAKYEYIAHHLAYLTASDNFEFSGEEKNILNKAGYSIKGSKFNLGKLGFQYLYLKSIKQGEDDIVAIRGTNPGTLDSDFATMYADTDPIAVGIKQYEMNRSMIDGFLNIGSARKIITGHSLGGGVAQLITAMHPDKISKVITFQSPGIGKEHLDQFNQYKGKKPEAEHHVVYGDLVDKAGEQSIPGKTYKHYFPGLQQLPTAEIKQDIIDPLFKNVLPELPPILEDLMDAVRALDGLVDSVNPFSPLAPDRSNAMLRPYNLLSLLGNGGKVFLDLSSLYEKELKDIIPKLTIMGGGLAAHGVKIISSSDFQEARATLGISDEYVKRPMNPTNPEKRGMAIEEVNWQLKTGVFEGYPFNEDRKIAEPVRDQVGEYLNKQYTTEQIQSILKTLSNLIEAIKIILKAKEKLMSNDESTLKEDALELKAGVQSFSSALNLLILFQDQIEK
jgi:pimeloyl-ACP methyl ester carboxylesterase